MIEVHQNLIQLLLQKLRLKLYQMKNLQSQLDMQLEVKDLVKQEQSWKAMVLYNVKNLAVQ